MSEHTPGPWHVTEEIDRFHGGETIRPGDGRTASPVAVICDFNRYDRDDERRANAQLIAAAPEVLEALKFSVSVHKSHGLYDLSERMAVQKAETAIAKAEGRK